MANEVRFAKCAALTRTAEHSWAISEWSLKNASLEIKRDFWQRSSFELSCRPLKSNKQASLANEASRGDFKNLVVINPRVVINDQDGWWLIEQRIERLELEDYISKWIDWLTKGWKLRP